MFHWPQRMDWQTYRFHRFRKARGSLYGKQNNRWIFPDHPNGLDQKNGFLAWNLPEEPRERMRRVLEQNPAWDGVYLRGNAGATVLKQPVLLREQVAWRLGDWPAAAAAPGDWLACWLQVGLLNNIRALPPAGARGPAPHLFLDIETACTEKQSVLADYYRDFYLSPLVILLNNKGVGKNAAQIASRIEAEVTAAGNILLPYADPGSTGLLPRWESPSVYLFVTEDPNGIQAFPAGLPVNTLKALLIVSDAGLPDAVDPGWDLCLAFQPTPSKLPRLQKPWQGWVVADQTAALLQILDERAHAHHLRCAASSHHDLEDPKYRVSVIISTYHRKDALLNALRSVAHQSVPAKSYEVIVVNNDPNDSSARAVVERVRSEGFAGQPERLTLINCPVPGLTFARNAGIYQARGEIVCILDDDAIADERWLEQVWQAFAEHPEAGVIGGTIRLKPPEPRPGILIPGLERFWTEFTPPYESYTEVQDYMKYPWGANWCARRTALIEMGGFRSQYGRRKRDFSGGEELIAAIMARRLGYAIAVEPSAVVNHLPDRSRYTFRYLINTIQAQIIIHYRMNRDLYLPKAITVSNQARGAGRFAGRLVRLLRLPATQRKALAIEYFGYITAWARLFFEQVRDSFNRIFWQE